MSSVATNQAYFNAFNEYLQDHNLVQAETDGYLKGDNKVYPVNFDMFFGFLVNKVVLSVINSNAFIDKLDKFYRAEYLSVGYTIEDKATILKSKDFEYDTHNFETDVENPFKKHKKGLQVCFHRKNEYKKITVTLSYDQLTTGCLTEGGVDAIINNIVNDVNVEYSAWAYKSKKEALTKRNYAQVITFKDYADFNLKLKGVKIDVTNYDNSYKHNACLLFRPTTEDNLAIIMSERFKNDVDINVFTGLFNVSYAELKDKITYIDEFEDPDVVCGIYDKRGFQFRKVLDRATELPNGGDMTVNRWTHFWRMHSVSPLYTAVVFKKASNTTFDDINLLVNGWDSTNNTYTANTTITAPFDGRYQIGNATAVNMKTGDNITVTNPHEIVPVVIKMTKTVTTGDTENPVITDVADCLYRVRFEYPSEVDAKLGHPMEIE